MKFEELKELQPEECHFLNKKEQYSTPKIDLHGEGPQGRLPETWEAKCSVDSLSFDKPRMYVRTTRETDTANYNQC